MIKTSLAAYNYRVVTASDRIEAIALYAQPQSVIQVILLDVMIPSRDNTSTIRALQRIDPSVS
jgi:two-component system, cell cycle sensor histidine kinase and response regulator CckA